MVSDGPEGEGAKVTVTRGKPKYLELMMGKGESIALFISEVDGSVLPDDYTDKELFFVVVVRVHCTWSAICERYPKFQALVVFDHEMHELMRWNHWQVENEEFYHPDQHEEFKRRPGRQGDARI